MSVARGIPQRIALLDAVKRRRPTTTPAIRRLPELAPWPEPTYLAALDDAVGAGELVENATGRPVALIPGAAS